MAFRRSKLRVLVANINPSEDGFFVPLIYGNLRSYWEKSDMSRSHPAGGDVDWLDPLMIPEKFKEIDARIGFDSVDVLAISVYQWNYAYQYELARYVRSHSPNCLIVAGGPHVDYKSPAFFEQHNYIDVAVAGEGEESFRQILNSQFQESPDWSQIQGVYLNPRFGSFKFVPVPTIDLSSRPSPWLELKDFWRTYFRNHAQYRLAASYESARGCPYGCTFCDWGSATNSKMRLVADETVKEELNFLLGELKPVFVFWTDSNLGMAARDLDLVRHFADLKIRTGFPRYLYYSNNKNSYERNLSIAQEFRRANLLTKYTLSLQHLDEEVIENLKRKNLPSDQVHKLVQRLHEIDYPIFVQFIIGSPGDTFEKWLKAYTDLMEMGVHSEYRAYPFNLLPNSPAADPNYMKKWDLRVIERPDFVTYYYLKGKDLNSALSKSKYVVGTKSYSTDDYIKMHLVTWMLMAFHDHGLTRLLAVYLRRAAGVSYFDFYTHLFEWFCATAEGKSYSDRLQQHIRTWLENDDSSLMIFEERMDGFVEAEESLLLEIYRDLPQFYRKLSGVLQHRFAIPESLIRFQRQILNSPNSAPSSDELFDESWISYFQNLSLVDRLELSESESNSVSGSAHSPKSRPFPNAWFEEKDEKKRLQLFYNQIVQHNVPFKQRTVFKIARFDRGHLGSRTLNETT